ncbi:MAG: M36 family metallopeptidase, partial [Prosthecobacter sp.]|nr:M36 family metallopeptidase [Prosthecobacter sp.]
MNSQKLTSFAWIPAIILFVVVVFAWFHGARREESQAKATPKAVREPQRRLLSGKRERVLEFDQRTPRGTPGSLPIERQTALAGLNAAVPGVKVEFEGLSGSASQVQAVGRFLTKAVPGGKASQVVADFVGQHRALFGVDGGTLAKARVTREDVTPHNGMTTLVWQQQVDGIPVYESVLKASVTKNGELINVGSQFLSEPEQATGLTAAARAALVAAPPVDSLAAVAAAAAAVGDQVEAKAVTQPEGPERKQRFEAAGLSDTQGSLAWLPMSADSLRLTWDVTLVSLKQNEMFRVLIDARTGETLLLRSLTNDISDASFRVFAHGADLKPLDSPKPFSPGHNTPLSSQPAEVARTLITTQALDTTASPNGWINDGGMETLGNNVDAHLDLDANNIADLPRPNGGAGRNFDFSLDLTQAPSTYRDAATTQLFYYCNWVHDRLYQVGFTESSGNFQTNNFGRGGNGNDAVLADAQDGSGTNNANFSTPADGSPGRMQMYVFTGPTPDIDGDFDGEIVIHEYAHGLSNRLVGGGVGMSALQSRGMGEGWSDFYGLALLSEPADDVNACYAAGGYATLLFSGLQQNYYFGIRRYPYSTDLLKNPLTFKDIDPTQASAHAGVPSSSIFGAPNGNPSEVHNQGEVWC